MQPFICNTWIPIGGDSLAAGNNQRGAALHLQQAHYTDEASAGPCNNQRGAALHLQRANVAKIEKERDT